MEDKDVNSTDTEINSAIDPVCGMTVNPERTDIVATVEGQAYYFCAEGCRKAFIENPKKYLEPKKKGWWGRYIERLEKATGGQTMKCH
jgi:YHS domain-containing protein